MPLESTSLTSPYYHREYKNDIPQRSQESNESTSWTHQLQRATLVALPFISLYKPLSFPLSLAMGGLRVIHCGLNLNTALQEGSTKEIGFATLQVAIAVVAVAGTIFAHPVGMIITTTHDLILETKQLIQNIQAKDYKKAGENALNIVNNALYLTLFLRGGIEIGIASLAMQILTGVYHSREEFQKGHYLEAAGHALMSVIRTHQVKNQVGILNFKRQIEQHLKTLSEQPIQHSLSEAPVDPTHLIEMKNGIVTHATTPKNYVGKLGDKWQFPSDHLPVGAKIGNAKIVSWNILNDNFMSWVTDKDSQGLNGSMISDLHNQPSRFSSKLTLRDDYVMFMLLNMMNDPVRGDHLILALQECHPEFIKVLSSQLPTHMGLINSDPSLTQSDHNIVLYNTKHFTYNPTESSIAHPYLLSDDKKTLMDLIFIENNTREKFQIMNSHIPGNPDAPGRNEFANYVLSHRKQNHHVIALGDMNFDHQQMQTAFQQEAEKLNIDSEFKNLIHYNTNIDPDQWTGKGIDHIWTDTTLPTEAMKPNQIFENLQDTVNLLHPDEMWIQKQQQKKREILEQFRKQQVLSA